MLFAPDIHWYTHMHLLYVTNPQATPCNIEKKWEWLGGEAIRYLI